MYGTSSHVICASVREGVQMSFCLRSYRGTKYSRGTSTPAGLMQKPAVQKYLTLGTVYVQSAVFYSSI